MKPVFVESKIILAVIGLIVFCYSRALAEDWKLFKETVDAKFYYDTKDVARLPQKMVSVWIKQVYTKKGKTDMVNLVGPRYENLGYAINELQFDCGAKKVRFLAMTYYSKNDDVLDLENPSEKWEPITPNSMFDTLHNKVCR